MKCKLTEEGKGVLVGEYGCSDIKELRDNFFVGSFIQDLIAAVNHAGTLSECNEVSSFLEGIRFQKRKQKWVKK